MGPLALLAKDAGHKVFGSDLHPGAIGEELKQAGIESHLGPQTGEFLTLIQRHHPIDLFVHTAALPPDHPELKKAREINLKIVKRDQLINLLVKELGLKLIAVSGTHGKTTTTALLVWAATQLKLPAAYLVGTTLPFAPAGHYQKGDKYLIYEADEYDRNFLQFHPDIGIITIATYDHPDIYPTKKSYQDAFAQFERQSNLVIKGGEINPKFTLAGAARREDATTALKVLKEITDLPEKQLIKTLNAFPGVGRRFEKLADGVYTDYAHHPEEIAATLAMAKEEAKKTRKKGVVAVYEPHQNTRQHQIFKGYRTAFKDADHLFWLPTYLTREDKTLTEITPERFIKSLENPEIAEPATLSTQLLLILQRLRQDGYLILLMTAGPADEWLRNMI